MAFLGEISRGLIVARLAEGQSWLTAVCFFAFLAAFAAAVFYAALGARNRKHTVAFAVFAIAMTIAAQKNMTNGTDGVSSPLPPMLQMIPPAGPMASGGAASGSATNEAGPASLEITSFTISTNGVGFAMCWPSGLNLAYLELQHSELLVPNIYTLLDRWAVDAAQTNDTRFVVFGGSFTNAVTGFFTAFGHTCDDDPDGDGLPIGMERSLGTDPFAADTDGDGSSDGEELGVATVLTGGDFLWFDISASVNRIWSDLDSYWWFDNPYERLRVGGERLGHIESAIDGFTHFYVSEIPYVWVYERCEDGVSFRTNSLSGGFLTVAAANADLYARPGAWGSALRCESVMTNGVTYYVLQCANLGLNENRTGESPLLSYEVIYSEAEPDVVYVSYGRVDAGIRALDMDLGVQVAAWRNPLATNEYYTLMCPVPCSNLCAGTTIRYKLGAATNPLVFDTDGDGAPDGMDPFPLDASTACFGQCEDWVRINFTNAEEILSVGYTDWVNAQVGTDLTNGLYKLTVTVGEDPDSPFVLGVGGLSVVVASAGDYVFLLEKGVRYGLSLSGNAPSDVAFAAVDDIPGGVQLLSAENAGSNEWSVDGALLVLNPPHLQATGSVIWYPTLTVTPGSWRPYIESAAETFTALVTDIPPGTDVSYEWSASDSSSVTISSPHARSTLISCNAPAALGWGGASLSVRASFAGEHLVSRLVFHYGSADPQVSVVFDKDGVIFEDRYEDSPGSWVERRSTNVALRVFAYGGSEGGTLQLTKSGMLRLHKLSGDDLPTASIAVGAGESVTYEAVYEGVEASSSEYDVSVSAEFSPNGSGEVARAQDSLTVIRLELQAVYEAPENPCTNRHVYGVGEKVRFKVTPVVSGANLRVVKADAGDNVTDYDTFGYEREIAVSGDDVYQCPATGTIPDVTMRYNGGEYRPTMTVVEPQSVEALSVSREGFFWPGEVCMGVMVSRVYVKPYTVSFSGVQIYEVPCTNAIPPTGYFASTNYQGMLTHVYPNAGYLHIPDRENYWATDRAGRDAAYPNWFAGTLTWKIPIGWRRILRGYENQYAALEVDYAIYDDKDSRPLLIGGGEDAYTQTFKIESDGTSSVRKFGYKLTRDRRLPFGTITQTGDDE